MSISGFTDDQIYSLVASMAQVLDDFGETGRSVCEGTKAQAREAFDPFIGEDFEAPPYSLETAKKVMESL